MLYPYQVEIVDEVRSLMLRGVNSILIALPTGGGKTVLTADMINRSRAKGMASWFIVHRRELVDQSSDTFSKFGVPHGVVSPGYPMDTRHLVQVCSIGTLANRMHNLKQPKLVVWDECQHIAASSWKKIRGALPNSFHIGLSATPSRLDGKGLGPYFSHMVQGPTVKRLISDGYLSKYKIFAPTQVSLDGVHKRGGDYVGTELASIMGRPTVVGSLVKEYTEKCSGMRAICFESSIELSVQMAAHFRSLGIPAEHVDGTTPAKERGDIIRRYRDGKTLVLFNVDLFGEGFDVPATHAVIDRSPSASLSKVRQRWGRALRKDDNKEFAIILDHAGNCARHGLPDDEIIWTLDEGAVQSNKYDGGLSVKVCPKCFAAQFSGLKSCKECGFEFPVKSRDIDHVDGVLTEVTSENIRRSSSMDTDRDLSIGDLIAIAKKRNYTKPERWAKSVFTMNQMKKLGGKK